MKSLVELFVVHDYIDLTGCRHHYDKQLREMIKTCQLLRRLTCSKEMCCCPNNQVLQGSLIFQQSSVPNNSNLGICR